MPSFSEIQAKLNEVRFRRVVLHHITEYLDDKFMPVLNGQPERVLLTDDRVKVPVESFESIITDIGTWISYLQKEEDLILSSKYATVVEPPPEAPPAPVEEQKPAEETPPAEPETPVEGAKVEPEAKVEVPPEAKTEEPT